MPSNTTTPQEPEISTGSTVRCKWSLYGYSLAELNNSLKDSGHFIDEHTESIPATLPDKIEQIDSQCFVNWWRVSGAECDFAHPSCSAFKGQFIKSDLYGADNCYEVTDGTMIFRTSTVAGGRTAVKPSRIVTKIDLDADPGPRGSLLSSVELYSPLATAMSSQGEQMTRFTAYGKPLPGERHALGLVPKDATNCTEWSKLYLKQTSAIHIIPHLYKDCGSVLLSLPGQPTAEEPAEASIEVFVPDTTANPGGC